jgi:molybdate-binding protein/transcriptional regulator with XRE-family HTH domain
MTAISHISGGIKQRRTARGWTQEELAERSGVSRSGISAIETGTMVPAVTAALAIAAALGCPVEELFAAAPTSESEAVWFSEPSEGCRFWTAVVNHRLVRYPVEWPCIEYAPHDGIQTKGGVWEGENADPRRTLVIASCDPAIGLLAHHYRSTTPYRMLVLVRSSKASIGLVAKRLVHMGGVHLVREGENSGNAETARSIVQADVRLLRIARWEEGLAFAPAAGLRKPEAIRNRRVRLVGRERDSGAGQCLSELLRNRPWPAHLARDHRGVAEAIRNGWADAGICVRLAGEEAGLGFITVRREPYDLCYLAEQEADPRVQALIKTVRSRAFRTDLSALPGYHTQETGTVSD